LASTSGAFESLGPAPLSLPIPESLPVSESAPVPASLPPVPASPVPASRTTPASSLAPPASPPASESAPAPASLAPASASSPDATHWFWTHVSPVPHRPQSIMPPQPSLTLPQSSPAGQDVAGVQPQTFAAPP